jgi:hypothetical protein
MDTKNIAKQILADAEKDEVLEKTLKKVPQLSQVQYSTKRQLLYLVDIAHKFGLYDAADVVLQITKRK